jgi:hypothetical protein
MQEQLTEQLVQTLQEKAGLQPDQARQVTAVVGEFIEQNLPAIMQAAQEKLGINLPPELGNLFGGGQSQAPGQNQ